MDAPHKTAKLQRAPPVIENHQTTTFHSKPSSRAEFYWHCGQHSSNESLILDSANEGRCVRRRRHNKAHLRNVTTVEGTT